MKEMGAVFLMIHCTATIKEERKRRRGLPKVAGTEGRSPSFSAMVFPVKQERRGRVQEESEVEK